MCSNFIDFIEDVLMSGKAKFESIKQCELLNKWKGIVDSGNGEEKVV
jgi:hypothetical protein